MDYDKLMNELDRLLDLLGDTDPGSEEYAKVLDRYNKLYKIFLDEDRSREDQIDKKEKRELEMRKMDLEEKRLELDMRKVSIQEKEVEGKQTIEQIKAQSETSVDRERARYNRSQAMWRLVEIGAQGVIMIAGIIVTGKLEETSILSSKAWSLIGKPKM